MKFLKVSISIFLRSNTDCRAKLNLFHERYCWESDPHPCSLICMKSQPFICRAWHNSVKDSHFCYHWLKTTILPGIKGLVWFWDISLGTLKLALLLTDWSITGAWPTDWPAVVKCSWFIARLQRVGLFETEFTPPSEILYCWCAMCVREGWETLRCCRLWGRIPTDVRTWVFTAVLTAVITGALGGILLIGAWLWALSDPLPQCLSDLLVEYGLLEKVPNVLDFVLKEISTYNQSVWLILNKNNLEKNWVPNSVWDVCAI